MFEKVIHQIENEWLLFSASFMVRLELVFVLMHEKAFSEVPTERA